MKRRGAKTARRLPLAFLVAAGMLAVPATAAATTFSNPTPITIPAGASPTTTFGPAAPYPSTIAVSGLGTVLKARVTLTGITHTYPQDIQVLLVGPTGLKTILWDEACGTAGTPLTGQTFTFDDAAATTLPFAGPCPSGTYKPTRPPAVTTQDFGAPAPAGPYPLALSTLNGATANGTWSLFVKDQGSGDVGSIAGGWSLDLQATDITPPQTVIGAKKIKGTTAKFTFSSNEPGSSFQCKLDKRAFKPCKSPKKYKHLSAGKHKFKVRAVDAAGNVDATPAKKKFKI
ncbi:MAG: hypothetical protein ABR536_04830 [Solirubrobacterales bacterium]